MTELKVNHIVITFEPEYYDEPNEEIIACYHVFMDYEMGDGTNHNGLYLGALNTIDEVLAFSEKFKLLDVSRWKDNRNTGRFAAKLTRSAKDGRITIARNAIRTWR